VRESTAFYSLRRRWSDLIIWRSFWEELRELMAGKKRDTVVFRKTDLGQAVYDVCFSRMSATEAVRRHPGITRKFVLQMRRENPEMRPKARARAMQQKVVHVTFWGPYFWKASPADNFFWKGAEDGVRDHRRIAWNVWAIQECGALANTEPVATFYGGDANRAANECVGLHNTALLKRLGLEYMPTQARVAAPIQALPLKEAM